MKGAAERALEACRGVYQGTSTTVLSPYTRSLEFGAVDSVRGASDVQTIDRWGDKVISLCEQATFGQCFGQQLDVLYRQIATVLRDRRVCDGGLLIDDRCSSAIQ